MTSKAQVMCKIFVGYCQLITFGHKMGKIHIVPLFWVKFNDVTVMLSLTVLS